MEENKEKGMAKRVSVSQHYRNFFELHTTLIGLDEDDHLNIDWGTALVSDMLNDVEDLKKQIIDFYELVDEPMPDGVMKILNSKK